MRKHLYRHKVHPQPSRYAQPKRHRELCKISRSSNSKSHKIFLNQISAIVFYSPFFLSIVGLCMSKPDKFAGKFEFLEHTADVYVSAHGKTMEEAYQNDRFINVWNYHRHRQGFTYPRGFIWSWSRRPIRSSLQLAGSFACKIRKHWTCFILNFKITSWKETNENFKIKAKIWGEKFAPKTPSESCC